ncbi:MAG: OmpA family protein [Bacteroidota bacterium]|nr:OmpA family protein [Bacteroidota bacterium]
MFYIRCLIYIFALALIIRLESLSQEWSRITLAGAGFGRSYPIIEGLKAKDQSITRLFLRHHFQRSVAVEGGLGFGVLEGENDIHYFSSIIIPVDVRFLLQPTFGPKFSPYVSGGVGIMYFNPVGKFENLLPHNARGDYKLLSPYLPLSAGAQYFFSENTAIELAASYYLSTTKYLDDIQTDKNDNYWSIMINLIAFIRSGSLDNDRDGLLNDEEISLGTNPNNPDTDGDGLKDGEEVKKYFTNPLLKDSDADRLNDREEIFTTNTNPNKKDTDGDGLIDGDEVLQYTTDPLNPDTDGEGLTDGDEVIVHKTNPLNPDTDGDGLTDAEEVLKHRTDPLRTDSDNDELTDFEEIREYKTNPLFADTDNGGLPDGKEIRMGLNPLDPKDDIPIIEVGKRMVLEGVYFETAKTTLLPESKIVLDKVVSSLQSVPTAEVLITGHTDNIGSARYNLKLSNGRAEAVKEYLVSKGISSQRISTKGFGFAQPIADNATPEGRTKNRRIEFVRTK